MRIVALLTISMMIFVPLGFGQSSTGKSSINTSPLTAQAHFRSYAVAFGGTDDLEIAMQLPEGYHAYLDQFRLSIEAPDDLKLGEFKITPIVEFQDAVTKKTRKGIEKSATLRVLVEFPAELRMTVEKVLLHLTYQACTGDHCLFPKTVTVEAPVRLFNGNAG